MKFNLTFTKYDSNKNDWVEVANSSVEYDSIDELITDCFPSYEQLEKDESSALLREKHTFNDVLVSTDEI